MDFSTFGALPSFSVACGEVTHSNAGAGVATSACGTANAYDAAGACGAGSGRGRVRPAGHTRSFQRPSSAKSQKSEKSVRSVAVCCVGVVGWSPPAGRTYPAGPSVPHFFCARSAPKNCGARSASRNLWHAQRAKIPGARRAPRKFWRAPHAIFWRAARENNRPPKPF